MIQPVRTSLISLAAVTRVPVLLCGVVCLILRLAVFIEYRGVTDTQAHRQTDTCTHTNDDGIYRAGIASRGKNAAGRAVLLTLFHRRTRASYVYNGCLAWYNVVLSHSRPLYNIHFPVGLGLVRLG